MSYIPPSRRLIQWRVIAYATNMYSVEQRVFIEWVHVNNVKRHFGISMLTKSCSNKLEKKLAITGSVLTHHAGGRKIFDRIFFDVKDYWHYQENS